MYLIICTTTYGIKYHYAHFVDEEIGARRGDWRFIFKRKATDPREHTCVYLKKDLININSSHISSVPTEYKVLCKFNHTCLS